MATVKKPADSPAPLRIEAPPVKIKSIKAIITIPMNLRKFLLAIFHKI
jgi:hypothetical protein